MKQIIFDYFCDLADDYDNSLTPDDVWEAHEYAFREFDWTEIYDQLDELVAQFLRDKKS